MRATRVASSGRTASGRPWPAADVQGKQEPDARSAYCNTSRARAMAWPAPGDVLFRGIFRRGRVPDAAGHGNRVEVTDPRESQPAGRVAMLL